MRKKLVKYSLVLILLIAVVGFVGIHFVAPYAIIKPQKINESISPNDYGLTFDKLALLSFDSVPLVGYHIKSSRTSTKGVVLLLHGIGGCKEHFIGTSNELSNKGIATFLFDNRAHGESGGEYATYGYNEKKDIKVIIDKIKEMYPNTPVGIWGNSLGGAVALQSLAFDNRIDFGVIESTFTDLNQIVFDYKKRLSGIGIRSVSDYVLKRAGTIANFDPQQVKPIQSAKRIHQPVFISHGTADKNISVAYGKQLHEALLSPDKELVLVKGGDHNDLFKVGGLEYKAKIMQFINKHTSN